MTTTQTTTIRSLVRPTLVYWHCNVWWPLEDGPVCPMEHYTPLYDLRPLRRGRKRKVWICERGEDRVAYFSRREFLDHDEEYCYGAY